MASNSTLSSPLESSPSDINEKALQFIEEITKNADAVQKDVLAQILAQNAQTEYLNTFNLDGATDRKTFRSKVPMTTYNDIEPFIRRIANGDRSPILCAHAVTELIDSSGTTSGKGKLFPNHKEECDRRMLFASLRMPIINKYVKGLDKGKALYFRIMKPDTLTPGGIPVRAGSASLIKSSNIKTGPYSPYHDFTSPNEAMVCLDSFQSMYTQMLCGLYHCQQVIQIGTMFASGLLRAIKFLQVNWQQLTHDIRTGSLNPKVTDESIRECMAQVLQPNPDLANFITEECAKDSWEGIISRIWPNTKYLGAIITGTMAQYIPILDYYSGGLPKVSMLYGSSECLVGINLNPMCKPSEISYTVMPNMGFFEFLPHEPNSSGLIDFSQLVDLVDVKIGKEYEIVVTTYTGLYRYQIGDILRVFGFHNSTPQFQFVKRKNMLLSIDVDKTDEVELHAVIEKASQLLCKFNKSVLDYTSYADTTNIPGHYVIYLELLVRDSTNSHSDDVLEQCCLVIEESLSSVYRQCRVVHKSIGPLEIRVVKKGTFEELMNYSISRGTSINQYKVPRCVNLQPMIDLLNSRVVSKHFSPSMPHWTAECTIQHIWL